MRSTPLLAFVIAFTITSCNQPPKNPETLTDYFSYNDSIEGAGVKMIPIQTPVGDFKVWTKRFGSNPKIKVLLLHGGPSLTHEYMECFETFFQRQGFEFYEYDQLGSYYSDQPTDSSLWTTERFVEEVEQVRQAIGADSTNFYILGNSWGGILGMEYALKYQQNLKGLIVANMMASAPEYTRYAEDVLMKQMKPEVLAEIKSIEAKKDYANPRYFELLMPNYYTEHVCRLKEWPDAVNRALKHANNAVYTLMQGPSEMGMTPEARLANWDIKARLKEIAVPTLMIGAKHDTMDPKAMEEQSKMVQKGRYLYCPDGSHLAMWDDQKVFMQGVIGFINDVDDNKF
ncbi:proline iminopeptidase-family hydrolase [Terrimonas sp. NA20]|uniref:Proline iminopeptidase-family hydrolase n=1 Tax=Terrimonas ginsenosidimutans TaxID=2908004 RepID=A0ABS9KUX2_9BACT|nr:proline iminopeptidase-family hydrolase [Terrimonas ginsenosidimutans]MCG2616144.1 proline iminopeptidase-family hydrolase [Terrimonas ginsenosidimutans]